MGETMEIIMKFILMVIIISVVVHGYVVYGLPKNILDWIGFVGCNLAAIFVIGLFINSVLTANGK